LKLPAVIQKSIRDRQLSMGHARALVNVADHDKMISIFEQIIKNELSVRKVEEIVRNLTEEAQAVEKTKDAVDMPEAYQSMEKDLASILSSKVGLSINSKGKGKIIIPFKSANDLERIIGLIKPR
jgi:ParB family chromosome partitioning protein